MPDSVEGRRRLAPEQRKSLLLEHAVHVFAKRGIGRGSHTDIAALGGVSVATAFNYFNTREDLVVDVLNAVATLLTENMRTTLNDHKDAQQGIRACCHQLLALTVEKPAYIQVWLEWTASVREETLTSHMELDQQLTQLLSEHIQTAIEQGTVQADINPSVNAFWLLGRVREVSKQHFFPSPCITQSLSELMDESLDQLLPAA